MLIMLVGYRGSGKSSIGKRLASDLWQKCVDTDALIVQKAGKSIAQIFNDGGEQVFRDIEAGIVADCCKLQDHVISLGGGAILRDDNRAAIKASGAKVFYLRCEPAILLKRINADPSSAATRPALTALGGGIDEINSLLAVREPYYREVATKELDVTHLGIEEAAKYISRML